MIDGSTTDLLRLLSLPVFLWIALADVRTRRVPNRVWTPLVLLAVPLLLLDLFRDPLLALPVLLTVSIAVIAAFGFWRIGGWGGADSKALMVLAVLFPLYPSLTVGSWQLPLIPSPTGSFLLTIVSNSALVMIPFLLVYVRSPGDDAEMDGIPFMAPLFCALVVSLVAGDPIAFFTSL